MFSSYILFDFKSIVHLSLISLPRMTLSIFASVFVGAIAHAHTHIHTHTLGSLYGL